MSQLRVLQSIKDSRFFLSLVIIVPVSEQQSRTLSPDFFSFSLLRTQNTEVHHSIGLNRSVACTTSERERNKSTSSTIDVEWGKLTIFAHYFYLRLRKLAVSSSFLFLHRDRKPTFLLSNTDHQKMDSKKQRYFHFFFFLPYFLFINRQLYTHT